MRAIWNGRTPETLNFAEMLTALAIYHVYEKEGDDYLETTQKRRLPWVLIRDIRGTTSRDVVAGFDVLFQESMELLRKAWNEDDNIRNEMKQKMEAGEFNPAVDFVNTPKMKNAIGKVLLRQAEVRNKHSPHSDEAFQYVKENLTDALKEMEQFVEEVLSAAGSFVVQQMGRHSLRPIDVNALNVKIRGFDETGPLVEFKIDENQVLSNDGKVSSEDKTNDKNNGYNPMYG